jgi:hypothetical protein
MFKQRLLVSCLVVLLLLIASASTVFANPPINDNVGIGIIIDTTPYTFSQNTAQATIEATDPDPTCANTLVGKTVWYILNAPFSGQWRLSTLGSNFDTVLSVYTGTPGALTQVGCSDDITPVSNKQSRLDLTVVGGTSYRIMIGGFNNTGGTLNFSATLLWQDDFDFPVQVNALPYTYQINTAYATKAADDPINSCDNNFGHSVWFRYTPPTSGWVQFNTFGSNYDTIIAVYTGSRNNLTHRGCADDAAALTQSFMELNLTAGTTYHIMVSGAGNSSGNLMLSMTSVATPTVWLQAPYGTISLPFGDPVYRWNHTGATQYQFRLANAATPQTFIHEVTLSSSFCTGMICEYRPTVQALNETQREAARLYNGSYVVYLRAGQGPWFGPYSFTQAAAAPGIIVNVDVIWSNSYDDLQASWSLSGPSMNNSWFNVVLWRGHQTPENIIYDQWHSRAQLCGSSIGTSCAYILPLTIEEDMRYYVGVRTYGPGGFSGNASGTYYTIEDLFVNFLANPPLPQEIMVDDNHGLPVVSWVMENNSMFWKHNIVIYSWTTNSWVFSRKYNTADHCVEYEVIVECMVIIDHYFPNGTYSLWINSDVDGFLSVGGPFNNGYNGPVDPNDTTEGGDFTFNMPAPTYPYYIMAQETSATNVNITFTGSPHAAYYEIWVGTENAIQTYHQQWMSADALNCLADTSCTGSITLNTPLPYDSIYYVAVKAVGPGGLNPIGYFNNYFWVSPPFEVDWQF